ncbi:MAG TPA: hypothetical protein VL551_21145 [Actinospica sp.]|jgi:hypothetical protein|nr:hypothetical protein [Actinospica sp.]
MPKSNAPAAQRSQARVAVMTEADDAVGSAFHRFDRAEVGAELFDMVEVREVQARVAQRAGYEAWIVLEQGVADFVLVRDHGERLGAGGSRFRGDGRCSVLGVGFRSLV